MRRAGDPFENEGYEMAMRTRRNVIDLADGDDTLLWYGCAVAAMKALPGDDPRSWTYQAAIHGTTADVPSSLANFLAQCEHGSSFFLPWHRMYLFILERIVAAQIASIGGPAGWTLPYWNYSRDAGSRPLPLGFRAPTVSDGSANGLYVEERAPGVNDGAAVLQDEDVDLGAALNAPGTTGLAGFFGPRPATHAGGTFGMVEGTVHNAVHVALGGDSGLMANPDFAALDPIFWLHHANIDRLWAVWLGRASSNRNLDSAYWLKGVPFQFHDATGTVVTMTSADVLDPRRQR